jgi:lipopolysaccharide/colanic/teichoic acid biosynthesis glycosyltransferase
MKRGLDLLLSACAMVVLAIPMLLLALLVWRKLGSPVFFRQTRAGSRGRPFRMVKFRTMTDEHDCDGVLLPDAQRLTPFGRLLRNTSLDELPELWNVFLGDMSLVGPRPLLADYVPLYTPHQARRLEVKPGITGWAQINGRNGLAWEERFDLDVWYVDNRSIRLDLWILVATVGRVFKREGVSPKDQEIMPRFMGASGGRSIPGDGQGERGRQSSMRKRRIGS